MPFRESFTGDNDRGDGDEAKNDLTRRQKILWDGVNEEEAGPVVVKLRYPEKKVTLSSLIRFALSRQSQVKSSQVKSR